MCKTKFSKILFKFQQRGKKKKKEKKKVIRTTTRTTRTTEGKKKKFFSFNVNFRTRTAPKHKQTNTFSYTAHFSLFVFTKSHICLYTIKETIKLVLMSC